MTRDARLILASVLLIAAFTSCVIAVGAGFHPSVAGPGIAVSLLAAAGTIARLGVRGQQ